MKSRTKNQIFCTKHYSDTHKNSNIIKLFDDFDTISTNKKGKFRVYLSNIRINSEFRLFAIKYTVFLWIYCKKLVSYRAVFAASMI